MTKISLFTLIDNENKSPNGKENSIQTKLMLIGTGEEKNSATRKALQTEQMSGARVIPT